MKFARYLEATQTPEWKRAYIDYRLLKKRIHAIRRAHDGVGDSSTDDGPPDDEPVLPKALQPPKTLRFRQPSPDPEARHGFDDPEALSRGQRQGSVIMIYAKSLRHPNNKPTNRFSLTTSRSTLQDILSQLTPVELNFFITLDAQLDKIEKFYQAREAELQARGKMLREQLEDLDEHKRFIQAVHSKPRTWASALITDIASKFRRTSSSRRNTRSGSDNIELSTLPGLGKGKEKEIGNKKGATVAKDEKEVSVRREFSSDPEDYLHAKKKLKKAALEHYRGLELLHNYRILNVTGFRKALKKLEKVANVPAQQPYMTERVEESAIASDQTLRTMMEEMESLYTARFTNSDRKLAMNRLRAGSLIKSHHYSSFRSGMLLGLALPPLVAGIWASRQPYTRQAIPAWDGLLFIYGILAVPVVFSVIVGLNLIAWARLRINYGFIFELDTRTRLDYREYFEVPSILAVTLCYAFWLSFFRIGADIVHPTVWPLIWIGFCFITMVNPLPIAFRSSRYWLLRNTGRLLLSGTRRVEFTDFWLGDQFCSLGFPLSNLCLMGCVYSTGFDTSWTKCGMTGRYWILAYVLGSLPLFVRLVQSVKRYVDSGLITHLINAGKYASGIISTAFYYVWRNEGPAARGPGFVLWCLANTVYSVYASCWDFYMDWSLLRVHAKHPFLRQELMYTDNIPLYYFAIISNLAIRFIWVIYIPKRGPNMMVRAFLVAMLEIFRRWQWNFYRLENEHLGNMDQYRVTREVPLPYAFVLEEEDDAEDREMMDLRPAESPRRQVMLSDTEGVDDHKGH